MLRIFCFSNRNQNQLSQWMTSLLYVRHLFETVLFVFLQERRNWPSTCCWPSGFRTMLDMNIFFRISIQTKVHFMLGKKFPHIISIILIFLPKFIYYKILRVIGKSRSVIFDFFFFYTNNIKPVPWKLFMNWFGSSILFGFVQ